MRDMVVDIENVTAKTVEEAARTGDELACTIWRETISFLAIGVRHSRVVGASRR